MSVPLPATVNVPEECVALPASPTDPTSWLCQGVGNELSGCTVSVPLTCVMR